MFRRPAALAAALAAIFVFPVAGSAHNGGADAVTVEGTLQFTHSDNFRTKQARYYYTLRQGHKQVRLQFKHRRQDLANGMRLSVRGMLFKGRLHVDHVHRLARGPRTYATVSPGVNLSSYQHVVYAFPFADSCYWSGLAEMPGSRVWINGYFMLQTLGHELSHNLGVHHASSLTCAAPLTYTYSWQRCGLLGSCVVIAGATSASYTLTSWDVGRKLKVTVTATNVKGCASVTSALSLVGRGSTSTPASARDKRDAGWAETALAITHALLARR